MFRPALASLVLAISLTSAPSLFAGTIENACRSSARGAAQAGLCHCIQQVAEVRLTRSEQRTVSKWFSDPHQAQVVRQSAKRTDSKLWEKYKSFGSEAERICG